MPSPPPPPPPPGSRLVFISYRRGDSSLIVDRIVTSLKEKGEFESWRVFRDIDNSIHAGENFVEKINDALLDTTVCLVTIGPNWLTIADASGLRRLDAEDDFVRWEIKTALQNKTPIIPVLVAGADMPAKESLPSDIRSLAQIQAHPLNQGPKFEEDIQSLRMRIHELAAQIPHNAAIKNEAAH